MDGYEFAGIEPPLDDILDDPIVRLLMARDGVDRETVVILMERLRSDRRVSPTARRRNPGAGVAVGGAAGRNRRPVGSATVPRSA